MKSLARLIGPEVFCRILTLHDTQLDISARPVSGEDSTVDSWWQHQALPVKVIVLQFISHGPLIIVLQVHHHS